MECWHAAEYLPKKHYDAKTGKETRRMNPYRRRTIPSQALVYRSAFGATCTGHDYRPTRSALTINRLVPCDNAR